MTYAAHPTDLHRYAAPTRRVATSTTAPRPGLLARLFSRILESRERAANRKAETFLARTGYRFTDSIERELNDRLVYNGWNARR